MTIAFWLIGLFLIVQFEANITADTTINKLASDISGIGDLPGKRVVTVKGSTAANFLADNNIQYRAVTNIEEGYALLESNQADAIVYDSPVLRYYAITGGNGKVGVVGPVFKPEKYGIALAKGSELRKPVNEVLLEMYQDGTLAEIEDRWFNYREP
jgi:ABC-type amino acid transport substrate-binding protein